MFGIDGLKEKKYKEGLKELYIPYMSTYVFDLK